MIGLSDIRCVLLRATGVHCVGRDCLQVVPACQTRARFLTLSNDWYQEESFAFRDLRSCDIVVSTFNDRQRKATRSRLVLLKASVTSNLDPTQQREDHRHGRGRNARKGRKDPKSLVVKILTFKPLWLKILQSIFANPAPVKAFRGGGGLDFPK